MICKTHHTNPTA